MANIQIGVEEKSKIFFYSKNQNNSVYFYPLSTGHFYCNNKYIVKRDNFSSILITFIVRGSFSFIVDGMEKTATTNQIAIIDCYNPHEYYTNSDFEAYWIHISGGNIYELYKEINSKYDNIISANIDSENSIKNLYTIIKTNSKTNDCEISLLIYNLLMELMNTGKTGQYETPLDDALTYINDNYNHELTVGDMADFAHLSESQFTRKFKSQIGTSPYDYVQNLRLVKAKELLKNTNLSVSEIAYQTGFSSDSNFIYFFKKNEGISPLKFRNLLF